MKQKLLLLSAAMLMSLGSIFAQGGTTGPLTWQLSGTEPNFTLTISGSGAMPDYDIFYQPDAQVSPWFLFRDEIYFVIIEDGVTRVGNNAFYLSDGTNTRISSISLPNSVTSIGANAFGACSNLITINIPNSVKSIEGGAFSGCSNLLTINIPNDLASIEEATFSGCISLQTITIPNSVKTIGVSSFQYCTSLDPITIPDSVEIIGQMAFFGCKSLMSITTNCIIPPALGLYAFPENILVYIPCNTHYSYLNSEWGIYNIISGSPDKQQICMISVDENNHNEIIWKKQEEVVSYNIYREGIYSGMYDLLATVDYYEPNKWVDMESNAKTRSYRYKIAAIGGVCNSESLFSDAHKTMHLTINAGMSNSWNLIWTAYEGMNYSTYNIYRSSGDTIGDLQFIGTMPSGNTTFSDFSAPQGYVYYMVEILLNETCNVGKAGSSIKSNIATNNPHVAVNEDVAISNISVYPNPTTEELRIESGGLRISNVEIFDVYGRKVLSPMSQPYPEAVLNISHLSAGVYFVRISTETGEVIKRVLKE